MLVLFFRDGGGLVCGKRGWLDDTANRTLAPGRDAHKSHAGSQLRDGKKSG